jgi:hypothetical protein
MGAWKDAATQAPQGDLGLVQHRAWEAAFSDPLYLRRAPKSGRQPGGELNSGGGMGEPSWKRDLSWALKKGWDFWAGDSGARKMACEWRGAEQESLRMDGVAGPP